MGNFNIITIKKQNSNEYWAYYWKLGFFNLLNSPRNNNKGEKNNNNNNNKKLRNKNKDKRTSVSRRGSKRNFKSYNINYEEQGNSDSYSDPSFDLCFNITTNIIEYNYNINSITPKNIKVNKVKARNLKRRK